MNRPKRFLMRIESSVTEPIENPICSILFDRKSGDYNLLNENQTAIVFSAILKKNFETIDLFYPFRVKIDLREVFGKTDIIHLYSKRSDILSAPISAYLEIAKKCNLKCTGCYQGERVVEGSQYLTEKQIFHFFESFAQIGGLIIRLTGKEPTTRKDILSIVSYGKSLGLKMALNTNGVVEKQQIEKLVQAGITEVVISLDGNEETHNQLRKANIFKKTIDSLSTFSSLNIDTRINMTVSPVNKKDIRFVAKIANDLGVFVSYIPLRNIGRAVIGDGLNAKDMKEIAQEIAILRKEVSVRLLTYFDIFDSNGKSDYYHPMFQLIPCHARKNIFISNIGNVYPCDHLVALGNVFCGGNIVSSDLLDIWQNGEGLQRYRNVKISLECTDECNFFRKNCYGGCVSEAFLSNKGQCSVLPRDRLCPKKV